MPVMNKKMAYTMLMPSDRSFFYYLRYAVFIMLNDSFQSGCITPLYCIILLVVIVSALLRVACMMMMMMMAVAVVVAPRTSAGADAIDATAAAVALV